MGALAQIVSPGAYFVFLDELSLDLMAYFCFLVDLLK